MGTCLPDSFSDPHFPRFPSRFSWALRRIRPRFTDNRTVLVGKKNLEVRPTAINKVSPAILTPRGSTFYAVVG